MTKAYSTSLRWRVMSSSLQGLQAKQIAERLFVSETFVRKIIKLYENTKTVRDPPRRRGIVRVIQGKFVKQDKFSFLYNSLWSNRIENRLCILALISIFFCTILAAELRIIRKLLERKPELYLDEIQSWLEHLTGNVYSLPTLSRALRNMGFSLKKVKIKHDKYHI